MTNWFKLGLVLALTIMLWMGVGLVDAAVGPGSGITDFAALIAFTSMVTLWLMATLPYLREPTQPANEKSKRDSRLALLLELMTHEERDTLRQRLLDDLRADDGEITSLADLIAAQDAHDTHRYR
jgi:hypothetical protein